MTAIDHDRIEYAADRAARAALWDLSKHPLLLLVISSVGGALVWALVWLTLGVSDLKATLARVEAVQAAQGEQQAAQGALQAEQGEQLDRIEVALGAHTAN